MNGESERLAEKAIVDRPAEYECITVSLFLERELCVCVRERVVVVRCWASASAAAGRTGATLGVYQGPLLLVCSTRNVNVQAASKYHVLTTSELDP